MKCFIDDCSINACFNYKGETDGLYCSKHKLDDMINIKHKKCIFENCKTIPTFNYENKKQAIYCNKHKLENMINIISKTCIFENCKTLPNFNYEGEKKAIYCNKHKLKDMINVISKTCIFGNCKTQPIFNYENEKQAIYCSKHKLENMIDVKNKKCILCQFNYSRTDPKFKKHCTNCFYYKFPEHIQTRNHKTKENTIFTDLLKIYPNIIRDKIIENGYSKRRPNGLIQLKDYNIIIEIVGDQHINYTCENKRIMEIFQDLGNSPLTIIRFNPDSYIDKNNRKHESLFKTNKLTSIFEIRNERKYSDRLNILIETIELKIENKTDKEIDVVSLFYSIE